MNRGKLVILGRGKSLERFKGTDADLVFIINDWEREMILFKDLLRGKEIRHFVNADLRSLLKPETYTEMGITHGMIGWTKKHTRVGKKNVKKLWKKIGSHFEQFTFMPDEFFGECEKFRNSGLMCVHYVSKVVCPRTIYLYGFDFYACRHLVMKRTKGEGHRVHSIKNVENMIGGFLDIVANNPEIDYKLHTYCARMFGGFPMLKNLEVI